ncbi:hypothetical protein [Bacillus sp. T33-2]|uniref:hypothetical protein n=1 Tax=Bacillus sp. T33-2 TaxID=2054168 RepID=UPI000C769E12|nr:hypothetical protein [Bacillus sp. T33-2]PLR99835.1 hypothetical protein CVD19_01905 [Bacillus sp. T33-2]
MKNRVFAVFAASLLFAGGCGKADQGSGTGSAPPAQQARGQTGFISAVSEKQTLINDVYYGIDNKTELLTDGGKKLSAEELAVGMKAEAWNDGTVLESFPAKAKAKKIVVFTDNESERLREGIAEIVRHIEAEAGKNVIIHSVQLAGDGKSVTVDATSMITVDITSITPQRANWNYDFTTKQVSKN